MNEERYSSFLALKRFVLRPLAMELGSFVFGEEMSQMNEEPSGMISQTFRYLYGGRATQVRLRWLPKKRGYELTIFRQGRLWFRAIASPASVACWTSGRCALVWQQTHPRQQVVDQVPTQPPVADRVERGERLLKRHSVRTREEAWLRRNPDIDFSNAYNEYHATSTRNYQLAYDEGGDFMPGFTGGE